MNVIKSKRSKLISVDLFAHQTSLKITWIEFKCHHTYTHKMPLTHIEQKKKSKALLFLPLYWHIGAYKLWKMLYFVTDMPFIKYLKSI